ncbi:MAG: yccB [Fusobacteria bacterium]|nr:MAG: yccB [Fusobacteriota bacterium]
MGWAKNGENAGTSGNDYRIEAMKVVLITKGAAAPGSTTGAYKDINDSNVAYKSYVQANGYQPWKIDGEISGITGMSLRMEAWMLKQSGELNKRVERINIGLEGAISANILQCSCAKYRLDGLGKKRRKCRHVRIWV